VDVGTLRFYVRTVDGSGVESDNGDLVEVVALTEAVPVTSSPMDLRVVGAAGGDVTVSWAVRLEAGESAPDSFRVYEFSDEPAAESDWSSVGETALWADGVGGGIRRFSVTFTPAGGSDWFGVRSVLGGVELRSDEAVAFTPDGSAPGTVGSLRGASG
jgi:hypothetical protein